MRVDELARDVGISKRTLYEQFRTKEEMAREALARLIAKLNAAIDEILAHEQDQAEQLRGILMQLCQTFARARPPFYRDLETTPALTELVEAARTSCFVQLEEVIRVGMAHGCFRAGLEPRLVRRTLLGAVEAIIRPAILAEERLTLDQAFDAILDVALHGLFVPGRAPPRGAASGAASGGIEDG